MSIEKPFGSQSHPDSSKETKEESPSSAPASPEREVRRSENAEEDAATSEKDNEKLSAIREKLGLKLETEESKEEKEQQERIFKKAIGTVAEAGGRIARVLQERVNDGFSPLMDEPTVSKMMANLRGLYELSKSPASVSQDELAARLLTVHTCLQEFGQPSRRGQVRESTDSLNKLMYGLQTFHQEIGTLQNTLADEKGRSAFAATEQLRNSSDRAYGFAGRLRSILRD